MNDETTFGLKPERLAKLLRIGLEKESEGEGCDDLLSAEQTEDEKTADSAEIQFDGPGKNQKHKKRGN